MAIVACSSVIHNGQSRITPGATVTVNLTATTTGANPNPGLFTLNGAPCATAG